MKIKATFTIESIDEYQADPERELELESLRRKQAWRPPSREKVKQAKEKAEEVRRKADEKMER